MQHNLSEAARLVEINRTTLWRHIKQGKLSAGKDALNKPLVETSELIRVYGHKAGLMQHLSAQNEHPATPQAPTGIEDLVKQIKTLTDEVKELRSEVSELRRLEYRPVPETKPETEPSGHSFSHIIAALRDAKISAN